jgi:hypothetical protein
VPRKAERLALPFQALLFPRDSCFLGQSKGKLFFDYFKASTASFQVSCGRQYLKSHCVFPVASVSDVVYAVWKCGGSD